MDTNAVRGFSKKKFKLLFFLLPVACCLLPVACFAAGVEVSVTGTKVGTGFILSWDIGLIRAAQTVYSCGAAPDVICADTGDVYWTITGSSDGEENISATVVSSGNWEPGGSSGVNTFVLKAKNDDALILDKTTPKTIYTSLPRGSNFRLGLAFTSPASGSSQGSQTMTITLTASNWDHCPSSMVATHLASGGVAPVDKTVTYGIVETNLGTNGGAVQCWITKNLGATNQASSATDNTEASAGWYWQFNRTQGYKHDGTTRTPATAWDSTTDNTYTGWDPAKDPCTIVLGSGWRLPTSSEWTNADTYGAWNTSINTFGSVLKLHAAGYLHNSNGALNNRGSAGYYWSSTQSNSSDGYYLTFDSSSSNTGNNSKAYGFSVRCVRD